MARFVQLHFLTSYPPANLNRDDLGRPKTAMTGGALRLRVSSQSLKRAWRKSDIFKQGVGKDLIGIRTKQIGLEFSKKLQAEDLIKKEDKEKWAKIIVNALKTEKKKKDKDNSSNEKKSKKDENLTEQLIHFSPEEERGLYDLVKKLAIQSKNSEPKQKDKDKLKKELKKLLKEKPDAVDIALFGRMFADNPAINVEASTQVAHAISVHSIAVEDDFFTAVEDLNKGEEHSGSAHLGVTEFGAGLFYLYVCIDKDSLKKNLNGNDELANRALSHLIECMATVAPTGKQNSFASRGYASYIRCEVGNQQPRSLSVAFLKPIKGEDMLKESIEQLKGEAERLNKAYGKCFDKTCSMNTLEDKGTLKNIIDCVVQA